MPRVLLSVALFAPLCLQAVDREGMDWDGVPHTYCSKGGSSVPLQEDDSMGFDMTGTQCRELCHEKTDCRFYTYGRWEKGLSPKFGGYYGKMRCQLYAVCDQKPLKGVTLFVKPGIPGAEKKAEALNNRLLVPVLVASGLVLAAVAYQFGRSSSTAFKDAGDTGAAATPKVLLAGDVAHVPRVKTEERPGLQPETSSAPQLEPDGKILLDLTSARQQALAKSATVEGDQQAPRLEPSASEESVEETEAAKPSEQLTTKPAAEPLASEDECEIDLSDLRPE